jgi:N6-L-threonylcarbamoyladenine synthase
MGSPVVLAVETSCDETAVAIFDSRRGLRASIVASQMEVHREFGGVVPEVASRSHLEQVAPVLTRALDAARCSVSEIDAFAATRGPGLATSLMIGCSLAKALAIGSRKPYVAINHLEGHLLSPFFATAIRPSMSLIVSGGHTLLVDVETFGSYRIVGRTRDDAAGEAFDKVGKLLDLPYPGGPEIDRLAQFGDRQRFNFPRSMPQSSDFSFSGLKTAVRYMLPEFAPTDLHDVCASFQEAVVDVLIQKTIRAAKTFQKKLITISGGVSCNSRLRSRFADACAQEGIELLIAQPNLCTDNAAMIAFVAAEKIARGESSPMAVDIDPNLKLAGDER